MAAPLDPALFRPALIVLGAAAVVIPLFHRLRLSPVLGFILVGLAVGPHGAGRLAGYFPWVGWFTMTDTDAIAPIAELGVVLLMFMIGLEMPLQRLMVMRRYVFGLGPLQMLLCTMAVAGGLRLLGLGWSSAMVLGLALAMSSTAVVLQVLSAGRLLGGLLGRAGLGVLLFQDLAAVPILLAVSVLSVGGGAEGELAGLLATGGKAVLAVLAILAAGRLGLRPLFRGVARTGSQDLFVAASLLVALGTSLAAAAAGLTPALGALVAGLILAETEYRRQVEATIDPFKGLLIGVFLISVGMSLDVGRILAEPGLILGLSLALVVAKGVVIGGLVLGFGLGWAVAVPAGLLLAPAGEFGFVVIGLAMTGGLVPVAVGGTALIVVAVGLATIPALGALGMRLGERMAPPRTAEPVAEDDGQAPRVVIGGFGRVGQTVASLLDAHRIPYIAVDSDPDEVAAHRARGLKHVFWGDLTNADLLSRLNLDTARALVVTMSDVNAADALVLAARAARADLRIIVRARDDRHAAHLYALGASGAVPETIEASLQLGEAVLVDIGVPMGPVLVSIHERRAESQARIRAMAPAHVEVRDLGRRRLRDEAEG
ncbi:MAG: cation:proton antiporter [Acetobacteraceae bacterium]|nr:cation:proton antiporter [Acetobacteraceae bacterium]